MTPLYLILFCIGLAGVLFLAELLLPTHGVLGGLAVAALVVAIGTCFYLNQWLGLGVLVAALLASPFLGSLFVRIYPRTLIGRRVVLQPVEHHLQAPPIQIGQVGVAVSELRPMGECEFGAKRIEVRSERGIVPAGTPVKIVSVNGGCPLVRIVREAEPADAPAATA